MAASIGSLKNCKRNAADRFIINGLSCSAACAATSMIAGGHTVRKKP